MDLKQYQAATEVMEIALQEDDNAIESWYLTGLAYLRAGDPRGAVEYLVEAVKKYEKLESEGGADEEEKSLHHSILSTLHEAQEIAKTLPEEPEGSIPDDDEGDDMETDHL